MGFAKLSDSIFGSSIMDEQEHVRLVWLLFIAAADRHGRVDYTRSALARMFNMPLPEINDAIERLESPDPESRSPDQGGRRLVRIDEHRDWGWQLVNHGLYRATTDDDGRREYKRRHEANRRAIAKGEEPPYPDTPPFPQSPQVSTKSTDVHGGQRGHMQKQKQKQKQKEDASVPDATPVCECLSGTECPIHDKESIMGSNKPQPIIDGRKKCLGPCGATLPLEMFSPGCGSGDRISRCRSCRNRQAAAWRKSNPEAHRAAVRRWKRRNRERHLEHQRRWGKNWRANHPDQAAANVALNRAVKRGDICRLPCVVCGSEPAEGHHHKGYEKQFWLDVEWLCPKHHREAHGSAPSEGSPPSAGSTPPSGGDRNPKMTVLLEWFENAGVDPPLVKRGKRKGEPAYPVLGKWLKQCGGNVNRLTSILEELQGRGRLDTVQPAYAWKMIQVWGEHGPPSTQPAQPSRRQRQQRFGAQPVDDEIPFGPTHLIRTQQFGEEQP